MTTTFFPTAADWFADPDLVQLWNQTWALPHMQAGLRVLMAAGLPGKQNVVEGQDIVHTVAIHGARHEGFTSVLRMIDAMRKTPTRVEDLAQPSGWGADQLQDPFSDSETLKPE